MKKKQYLSLIYACDLDGIIGLDGELPWHCKRDLEHFRASTMGRVVICGSNTYRSMPSLPGRTVVVITNNEDLIYDLKDKSNVLHAGSLEAAVELANQQYTDGGKAGTMPMVIGGGRLLCEALETYPCLVDITQFNLSVDVGNKDLTAAFSARDLLGLGSRVISKENGTTDVVIGGVERQVDYAHYVFNTGDEDIDLNADGAPSSEAVVTAKAVRRADLAGMALLTAITAICMGPMMMNGSTSEVLLGGVLVAALGWYLYRANKVSRSAYKKRLIAIA